METETAILDSIWAVEQLIEACKSIVVRNLFVRRLAELDQQLASLRATNEAY